MPEGQLSPQGLVPGRYNEGDVLKAKMSDKATSLQAVLLARLMPAVRRERPDKARIVYLPFLIFVVSMVTSPSSPVSTH